MRLLHPRHADDRARAPDRGAGRRQGAHSRGAVGQPLPLPELVPYEQPVIASREVNYVGEPIAVAVADTPALADDALDAIVVDIETLPAVVDCHHGKLAIKYTAKKGDALNARAPYRRKE